MRVICDSEYCLLISDGILAIIYILLSEQNSLLATSQHVIWGYVVSLIRRQVNVPEPNDDQFRCAYAP